MCGSITSYSDLWVPMGNLIRTFEDLEERMGTYRVRGRLRTFEGPLSIPYGLGSFLENYVFDPFSTHFWS